jgi:probable F420-dependent oxidoreductase
VKVSVVLPYWLDRPALEAVDIARSAAAAGFEELWIGEMMTFDAFALAAAIVRETEQLRVVVGPLAIAVRTAASLALGITSVSELGGRRADLALGASTPVVVRDWHGRSFDGAVERMRETVAALKPMLAGEKSSFDGRHVRTRGFRMTARAAHSTITVAAFGTKMLDLAATVADRVVVNLVTTTQVARVKQRIAAAAAAAGKPAPPLAVWLPAAIAPTPAAWEQLARQLVVYLAPKGYGEMFIDAGFGSIVEQARSGTHPRDLLRAMPRELVQAVGAIGSGDALRSRLAEYARAGADEAGIVPVTAHDDAGRTLLRDLAGANA